MGLSSEAILNSLRAVAEETRLRIVALLRHGELTVSDLTDILGQSQPRISRHLKLLADAGVVDKHREGTWAFFDLVTDGALGDLVADVLARTDDHDTVLAADLDRLSIVRGRRGAAAQEYFAGIAERWDEERSLHAADEVVESAIIDLLGPDRYRSVLDLGTGTGRMLQLLATDRVHRAVGLDSSHSMLAVARDNLERAELRGIDLRQGDVYSPPLDGSEFDLVVIHQVLHFLDDPARAIREAAQLLAPGGRLLIVDFAPHSLEFLRTDRAHRRLGFRSEAVAGWLDHCGLDIVETRNVAPTADGADEERLTVSLWLGRDRRPTAISTDEATADREERDRMTITVSFEVFPPKSETGLATLAETAARLTAANPCFVSVTYGAGGSDRDRSFDAIRAVATADVRIAGHLTCVGQSRDEIDDVIEVYRSLGVDRVVALRGDPPCGVDAPYEAHRDGYQSTADLVSAIRERSTCDVAVSAYPERHPQSPSDDHDLNVLAEKVDAGADRAITQMFFDNEHFVRYRERVHARGIDVPIVPGIFPIHSFPAVANFAERCGATMPERVAARFRGLDEDPETAHKIAAELAAEQIDDLAAEGVEHVHIYTLNRPDLALDVCERIGLT